MSILSIETELSTQDQVKAQRLKAQTDAIRKMSDAAIEKQGKALDAIEDRATPQTKRVLRQMDAYHGEFNNMLMGMAANGKASKQAYINYLIQAWYHTKFTPEFETLFGQRLAEYVKQDTAMFDQGNKFIRLIEEEADEELGHELWALEDVRALGGPDKIDLLKDVWPETRALVRTQFDRLNRLNFKGFLGYSFYLEFWVAKYAKQQLGMIDAVGIQKEATSFLYNHYVVDQGHAADNIELLNFLIKTDEDVDDVLDNMSVIHALYYKMIEKCF